eukprot:CAMPEP_0118723754 /NCGR_PEP_ID=MMETSP0800-20121206/32178_1 /TAXON_ID=210618 ORGANISM="Striatella unipunctata, Strain CCMP2910" /NCGR_SAMPLE_ID=MMETSP0800 /ASSEMBLY_ACC=CAM_ASM_000638 /LENGTH=243 /DNA_ID=CAMNT_0006632213 /DNA_START=79 /DNA_END=808 /DNA_ORIENTATION=-
MKHLLNAWVFLRLEVNDKEPHIKVCSLEFGSVVNVDASSPDGIERAAHLGLADQNIPRLVIDTSRVYEALQLLTEQHKGRLFVLLRDPVERAISKFYYTKIATWERNYKPEVEQMTMLEYADTVYCYNNWVTRRLVNKMSYAEELTEQDLFNAKVILEKKALVLFTDSMLESAGRLAAYFGWAELLNADNWNCIHKFAIEQPINTNPHPLPAKDSPEYKAIEQRNLYDVELYAFAKKLYQLQG